MTELSSQYEQSYPTLEPPFSLCENCCLMLISNVFSEHKIKWMVQRKTTIILLYNEHLLITGTEAERKQQTKQSSEWHRIWCQNGY